MPPGWAGRVRERTPQEARWKGSREGREWCVRRRWGDGRGQRRDAGRQKDGWKGRRQRRPIGGETHHLWMTLQARCLSQRCTSPLTLYNAHSEHGAECTQPGLIERDADVFWTGRKLIPNFWTLTLWSGDVLCVSYIKQNCSICILELCFLASNFFGYPSKCETLQCIHLIVLAPKTPRR